jgi:chromosome segregation ATPase
MDEISRLTETVESQEAELDVVKLELEFKNLALVSLQAKLDTSQEQIDKLKKTLRVERRKFQRTRAAKLTLQQKVHALSAVILPDTRKEVESVTQLLHESEAENEELQHDITVGIKSKYNILEKQLADALNDAAEEAEGLGEVLLGAKTELEQSRKIIHKLKAQKSEIQEVTKAYRKRAKDAKVYKATCKGIYTPEMCSLALFLVEAGCS